MPRMTEDDSVRSARGKRFKIFRERISRALRRKREIRRAEMAKLLGLEPGAYYSYEKGSAPNLTAIALGLKNFKPSIYCWPEVLAWLGTGAVEPSWLSDGDGSPFSPSGPSGAPSPALVAEPLDIEERWRLLVLQGRRQVSSGEIEDPRFVRGVLSLEDWLATVAETKKAVIGSAASREHIIRNDEAVSSSLTASFAMAQSERFERSEDPAPIIKLDDVKRKTSSLKEAI